mgnify:CR=1 FL=1
MDTVIHDRYVSRTERQAGMVTREEPVVYNHGRYADALNHEQLDAYQKQGFLVLDELFDDKEVKQLLAEITTLSENEKLQGRPEFITEPNSSELRSLFAVHQFSKRFDELMRDPRVLDVARQILGSEVYVHQSRVNFKPGFKGKEFYWHSDFETWHVEDGMPAMRAVSCSIMLTDNNVCNGPLMLIPGSQRTFLVCPGETPESHHERSLKKQDFGVPDPLSLTLLVEECGGIEAIEAKAGSVIFFDCNTMHGSAGNISPWPRANAFFVYNSVENVIEEPKYGLRPRPEYLAHRKNTQALKP